eukprot:TRINITY_DN536_c0_g1_i1.p1 TRINITY_DN536_c0_g1~~TRINITY_DN536_c0_g1_i1.p1  ORF type:complete len:149 (-),score=28.37 TRINITY_DN536_c0_g1_i1:59-505(-)
MTSPQNALFLSAKAGRSDDVQELLKTNINFNAKDELGNTALHYASSAGHTQCVQLLLNSGKSNPDAQNNVGDTPLHKVVFRNNKAVVEIVKAFIKAGANTQLSNKDGQTPYDICRDAEAKSLLVPHADVPEFDPDLVSDDDSASSDTD